MQSQSDRDARIRDRAYQIWLSEGRPHGRDEAHWQQAERDIETEEAASAGAERAPVTTEASPPTVSRARTKDEATAKKTRSPAAVAANGEAPVAGGGRSGHRARPVPARKRSLSRCLGYSAACGLSRTVFAISF